MTTEATSARFPWGLTIVCALAFALLCGLGVWQVRRMQWKNGLIDQAEAAAALPRPRWSRFWRCTTRRFARF